MTITIFSDGGARGNPGPAGIGAVLLNEKGHVIAEISEYIGETTNNQAEYCALTTALRAAKELGATQVKCFLDSELIVNQLNHKYKVKDAGLATHFLQAHNLSLQIGKATYSHIPREQNKHADALVNQALDSRN